MPPARSVVVSGSLEPISATDPGLFQIYESFGVRCGNGHEVILNRDVDVALEWCDAVPISLPRVYRLLPD